jgi:hypothetical protein
VVGRAGNVAKPLQGAKFSAEYRFIKQEGFFGVA